MAEYIERDLARLAVCENCDEPLTRCDKCRNPIDDILAADVVPVVRCKDCRFWNRDKISVEGLARCNTGETGIRYRTENDFCSRGMRMDGDGE